MGGIKDMLSPPCQNIGGIYHPHPPQDLRPCPLPLSTTSLHPPCSPQSFVYPRFSFYLQHHMPVQAGDHQIRTEGELTSTVSFLPTDWGITVDIVDLDLQGAVALTLTYVLFTPPGPNSGVQLVECDFQIRGSWTIIWYCTSSIPIHAQNVPASAEDIRHTPNTWGEDTEDWI